MRTSGVRFTGHSDRRNRRRSGLAVPVSQYLNLPGGSANNASTPDSVALSITGDIDIRARVSLADWTPSAVSALVAKFATSTAQRSYYLRVATNGALTFLGSSDGTTSNLNVTSSAAVVAANGAPIIVRVTRTIAAGEILCYTHADQVARPAAAAYTQLGNALSDDAGALSDSTAPVVIGAQSSSAADPTIGKVYWVEIRDGIDGTVVASPDFTAGSPGAANLTDAQGNVWTFNGTAALV